MFAPFDDLRTFVRGLESKGALFKVTEALSPKFEIAAALRYLNKHTDHPVLFDKIVGYDIPVIGNLFQSYASISAAFGIQDGKKALETYRQQSGRRVKPEMHRSGPVMEAVTEGQVDILKMMPVLTHHENDAGPYFSSAVTIAKDPESGIRGMGIHRIQVKEKNKLGIFLGTRPLSRFLELAELKKTPLEIAIVLGMDPLTFLSSITYAPEGIDKFDLAGGLRGRPVELTKCKTVDLEVPRHAEFVLEGKILPGVRETEGPFGESGGAYLTVQNPVAMINCICQRKQPMYHALMPFNKENGIISNIVWEATQLDAIRKAIPLVKKMHLLGSVGEIAAVQIEKKADDDGRKTIQKLFDLLPRVKGIVVVDTDIDVHDPDDLVWAVFTRFQVSRDLVTVSGVPGSVLDPSIEDGLTSKWGLDATRPGNETEKFKRIAPPDWAMRKVTALLGE
ncbi:MAG: UbiD family decarboxylase [Desulfobacterales bacterium]|nr:UbiD family decarboxylase [Desulfobacterales bacterium]